LTHHRGARMISHGCAEGYRPVRSLGEVIKEPVSGLTHLASAAAALAGGIALWYASPPLPARRAAFLIYGLSLFVMFTASAVYHLVRTSARRELFLRRVDHTAIFLLIAGTYTPVCVVVLPGVLGTALLAAIWVLAAAGILIHLFFISKVSRWLSIMLYALMGWLGIVGIVPLVRALPLAGLAWLLGGGVIYTAGALVYATKKLDFAPGRFGFHEVWHIFVTAAAACHFAFVRAYIVPLP
jgi:hemolysin III